MYFLRMLLHAYEALRTCHVIFVCQFGLFGKAETVYQFENFDRKNDLPLGDFTNTIMLNTTCVKEKMPESLRTLLEYIRSGKISEDDVFVEEIHHQVIELNEKRDLMGFMTLEEDSRLREKWARKKGFAEGEQKGRLEIARNMKADGIPLEQIMKYTQLTEEVRDL
ncbi:MAG: Rpn family recombination-promoting nuclease/putative transposase [Emergencia sp.]|jgi:predicted transposase/invertase (TIGR01784 family)|uniref:Rpn family recombination-promoting nuclease/putative transposase n=2 Tax=Anaerotruncus TaxID=244127 RepID=A0A845QPS8_9FIRM|nr:Rpn family recombination-promoting nuclease/putative transposase [Anaerotruncus colihominis]MCI9474973.1 Rpn family recombination-promoting nuclease/putative transposase [Emergencia sp.]NBH62038.1 Rpn family recombination-promoting nuclease/putative transposase [Anaerotruncus colihominis]NCF02693.1 Rpn family recombination-promoting nuclease/putative transposase [Anaerotruncus sp. 80]